MPLYSFQNTITGEEWEATFKIAEKEDYLLANPHIIQTIKKVSLGDPIKLGVTKRHSALTDKLKAIKSNNRGSTIDV